ncbi:nicotinate-nucleotide--dimethylbenzimidazole phosphoribosyltransferase [Streptomyces sp. NPDC052114]|uniref:nicotinate-nucleotide--dimethylbenzimidazole phosphoribosyltransferase n=1 Tax=unclassified Streptomyces TaxID=2593676 RepID=UPI00343CBDF1
MTDTGQVPGEGLPEGAGNGVPTGPVQGVGAQQPGVPAPGAYTFVDPADPSENTADEDDLLLMPGAQGAWSETQGALGLPGQLPGHAQAPGHGPFPAQGQGPAAGQGQAAPVAQATQSAHQPGPHETSGRDSGSVDLTGVRMPGAAPAPAPSHPSSPRRPLHRGPSGPVVPDGAASPVRSLADRGPAGATPPQQHPAPARHAGPPTGPEYLDIPRDEAGLPGPQLGEIPQGAAPWSPQAPQGQMPQPPQAPMPQGPMPQGHGGQEAYPASAETVVPGDAGAAGVAGGPAATDAPDAPGAPDVTQAPQFTDVPQAADAPQTPDAAFPGQPVELPAQAQAQYAAQQGGEQYGEQYGAGQVPSAEQQFAPAEQQFATGEQPAFAQAVPAAVGQSPFAVAPAQPWDGAQVPHADAGQAAFAPDAFQGAPEGPVGVAHMPEPQTPQDAAPADASYPGEPDGGQGGQPIGQFVPVEGTVPTTPHLAPTPPRPLVVPPEVLAAEAQAQEAAAPDAQAAVAPDAEQLATAEPLPADAQAEPVDPAGAAPVPVPQPEAPEAAVPGAVTPEAAPAEGPVAVAEDPHAAPQGAAVPAPRDAAEQAPAPDASVQEDGAAEAAEATADPAEAGRPAVSPDTPQTPQAMPASSVADRAEFPAAPETADPAEELDEADDVISFEPIDANEVTEVAEAPEMAEAPEAPETTGAPEALAAAPEAPVPTGAPEAQDGAEVPELLDAEAAEVAEATDAEYADESAYPEPVPSPGTAAPGYADAEREAVLRVMRERRDIRNGFRNDAIPHEVLLRVLEAAHTAPSVGHSQPWDFVVIKSAETRRTMHELAMRQRDAYAKSLPKGRAKQFKELKIEAILDTPVNIVVTADPTRGGRHTLGRHTQPQMAPYSSALAVENLWLAARAEGLGVGWVSFFDEREMVRALGLPEHLEVVAYLCVGYVDEFPDEPELMQAGWSKRRPLSWVVHEETYGRRALPGEDPHDLLAETVANIRPLDAKALGEAWERQKRMTKPPGALGMLEIISAQLSGLSRMCPPPIPEPAAVAIFAGDHGVHAQGVTAWPQEVTAQMVANFLGGGAVCNAFANQVGAEVCVIDVGVASELPATPGLLPRKVRAGTADMTTGPALTREEVKAAVEVGIETARDLVAAGNKALLTGEMGIANTTASAALISVYTDTDPAEVTGRGTGINDEMHTRKIEVVRRALDLHKPDPADPIGVLAAIGGLEHAAMVGLLLGGASLRTPVILDGVSAGAAALVARAIAPEVLAACIAGHRSAEPGHVAALNKLGLRPLVDLDLRLGEGTGALLALPVVQSAARAMHEVATFDSAGVTEK